MKCHLFLLLVLSLTGNMSYAQEDLTANRPTITFDSMNPQMMEWSDPKYESVIRDIMEEDYGEAVKNLTNMALSGDAKAQCALATMYCFPAGTERNYSLAFILLKNAALQRYERAEYLLGAFESLKRSQEVTNSLVDYLGIEDTITTDDSFWRQCFKSTESWIDSYKEAFIWFFIKDGDWGYRDIMYFAALKFLDESSDLYDVEIGLKWLNRSANLNNLEAKQLLESYDFDSILYSNNHQQLCDFLTANDSPLTFEKNQEWVEKGIQRAFITLVKPQVTKLESSNGEGTWTELTPLLQEQLRKEHRLEKLWYSACETEINLTAEQKFDEISALYAKYSDKQDDFLKIYNMWNKALLSYYKNELSSKIFPKQKSESQTYKEAFDSCFSRIVPPKNVSKAILQKVYENSFNQMCYYQVSEEALLLAYRHPNIVAFVSKLETIKTENLQMSFADNVYQWLRLQQGKKFLISKESDANPNTLFFHCVNKLPSVNTTKKNFQGLQESLIPKNLLLMKNNENLKDPIVMPHFPGDNGDGQVMIHWFIKNIVYPEPARDNNIEGIAYVQFMVDKDGSIYNPQIVLSSCDKLLDDEALRVVGAMPKWVPGTMAGKPVSVKYTIPVRFRLGSPPVTSGSKR